MEDTLRGFSVLQKNALKVLRCIHCGDPMELTESSVQCVTCLRSYAVGPGGIIDTLGRVERKLTLAQRSGQWRFTAWVYDRFWRRRALSMLSGVTFPSDLEIEIVARTVDLDRVQLLLDNACGNAFYGRALARKMTGLGSDGVVIANDLSLPMLEKALAYARREGIAERILFVRSDSERMPFAPKSFDAISCGGSFNEFQDPAAYLAEVTRVLKTDGRMSLMCQVESPRRLGAVAQRLIARLSGLRFPASEDLIEFLGAHLSVEAVLHVGAVVLSKLKPHESGSRQGRGPLIVDPDDLTISAPISSN